MVSILAAVEVNQIETNGINMCLSWETSIYKHRVIANIEDITTIVREESS